MTERWVQTDMSETTDRGLHYYVLPDGPVAALNDVLREAAGLGPRREDGEEVGGDVTREAGRGAMNGLHTIVARATTRTPRRPTRTPSAGRRCGPPSGAS